MKKKSLLLVFLIIYQWCFVSILDAQIVANRDSVGRTLSFTFQNETTASLNDLNPFYLIDKVCEEYHGSIYYYGLKITDIPGAIEKSVVAWLDNNVPGVDEQIDVIVFPVYSLNDDCLLTSYFLSMRSQSGCLGQTSIFTLYDSMGIPVFQKQLPYDCQDIMLNKNNDVFGLLCGGPLGEDLISISENQIVFFDIKKNEEIAKIVPQDNEYVNGLGGVDNIFLTRMSLFNKDSVRLVLYDTDSRLMYSRNLSFKENISIVEINSKGIILSNKPNQGTKDVYYYFDKDFVRE